MSKSFLPYYFLLICLGFLSSCASISSYCPSMRHLPDSHVPGNLKVSGGIELNTNTFSGGSLSAPSSDIDIAFNGELIYAPTKHISCFGAFNNNMGLSNRKRSYYDAGIGYLFGDSASGRNFGITAGCGLGSYSADGNGYLDGQSGWDASHYYTVYGNANYFNYYIQPYIYWKMLNDRLRFYLSLNIAGVNYYNYKFYGEIYKHYSNPGTFYFEQNDIVGMSIEPAVRLAYGWKNLKFFSELITPALFTTNIEHSQNSTNNGFTDSSSPVIQLGFQYNFRLK